MADWKHDALALDLAKSLLTDKRMVWTDMQLGPSGSPRPDVYTIEKSYTNPVPTAYEIKISRADFLSDVTSGKWMKYRRYAGGVVFATPAGLVDKKELPAGCGLMVRGDECWRTLRRPTREAVTLPQEAMLKLLIDGCGRAMSRRGASPRVLNRWTVEQKLREKFGERVARVITNLDAAEYELQAADKQRQETLEAARLEAQRIKEKAHADSDPVSRELCQLLGLERWNVHLAHRAVQQLRESVSADARVQAADRALSTAASSLSHATDAIERARPKAGRDAA